MANKTTLPRDGNNQPIPAVRLPASGGAHAITTSGTTAKNATAFSPDRQVVSLYATKACFIKFGDANVQATASDHYFPAGVYYDFAIGGTDRGQYTHVAALQVSEAGVLYVSEKE